ncbi:unnamed protein product, partial [Sphacelaria rigidula]
KLRSVDGTIHSTIKLACSIWCSISYRAVLHGQMATGGDSPSWTFGLNPKAPESLIPGPGTYNIAGDLARGAGTRFGVGPPEIAQSNPKRLLFDGEKQEGAKPGPGAYDSPRSRRSPQWQVYPPKGNTEQLTSLRFPDDTVATDAGPGAYIYPEFSSKGPAFSISPRPPTSFEPPESPGPGQYVSARLADLGGKCATSEATAGFGKRNSPRFGAEDDNIGGPGPGAYQSPQFTARSAKNITFGRCIRPAGWSAKIRDIVRISCEVNGDSGKDAGRSTRSSPRKRISSVMVDRFYRSRNRRRRGRRPSSAPASYRLLRACARGRRHQHPHPNRHPNDVEERRRPIAQVIKEAGRRRKDQAHVRAIHGRCPGRGAARPAARGGGASAFPLKGAVFGTSPQRPRERPLSAGPATYRPSTLDEAARNGRVLGIGGKSGRDLFSPPPDTPGPDRYSPGVLQGPAVAAGRSRMIAEGQGIASRLPTGEAELTDICDNGVNKGSARVSGFSSRVPAIATSPTTFGSSERFPRDPERALRPGVGDYDLRSAETQAPGAAGATTLPITFGRRQDPVMSAPYNPSLNRYLRADTKSTPSPHAYRPESAAGGGGARGAGGHACSPPAWSFGRKRKDPCLPAGPGPGRTYFGYQPSSPAVRFRVARAATRGIVSGVPWEENVERLRRGEAGGVDAKLYLPGKTRFGD